MINRQIIIIIIINLIIIDIDWYIEQLGSVVSLVTRSEIPTPCGKEHSALEGHGWRVLASGRELKERERETKRRDKETENEIKSLVDISFVCVSLSVYVMGIP